MTSPDQKSIELNDVDLDAVAGGLRLEEMYEKMKEELVPASKAASSTARAM